MGLTKYYWETITKVYENYTKAYLKKVQTKWEEAVSMAKARGVSPTTSSKKIRPAMTPEAREQQMISLAVNLVEQRLLDGTASAQETSHYLKLAAQRERRELENEKLKLELELTKAKTESIKSQQRSEEMFEAALRAFKGYSGQADPIEEGEDDYDEY